MYINVPHTHMYTHAWLTAYMYIYVCVYKQYVHAIHAVILYQVSKKPIGFLAELKYLSTVNPTVGCKFQPSTQLSITTHM